MIVQLTSASTMWCQHRCARRSSVGKMTVLLTKPTRRGAMGGNVREAVLMEAMSLSLLVGHRRTWGREPVAHQDHLSLR